MAGEGRWRRAGSVLGLLLVLLGTLPAQAASRCFGRPGAGRIEGAVQLPASGPNYRAYTVLAGPLGRTYVHDRVAAIVLDAYARLARSHPRLRLVHGETGGPRGGRFRPHRTHQNGTSVDFFVPLRDAAGAVAEFPGTPFNRYGYDLEFDARGRLGDLRIDFDALAAWLLALDAAARAHDAGLALVILDPALLPLLYAARDGAQVRRRIRFMPGPAWVRHDEHFHVDFAVKCESS